MEITQIITTILIATITFGIIYFGCFRRKYYKTRDEAMEKRKNKERIYYDSDKESFYLVKVKKRDRSFWDNW